MGSPSGSVQVGEIRRSVPVVRANHPILEGFQSTYGGSEKALRGSRRRQDRLGTELLNREKGAENAGCDRAPPFDAAQGLAVLALARKVRSSCTIACVCCDLYKHELHVQFKERQLASDAKLLAHLTKKHSKPDE